MKINKGTTVKINSDRLKQFSGCEGEIVEVQPIYRNTSDRVDQAIYTEFVRGAAARLPRLGDLSCRDWRNHCILPHFRDLPRIVYRKRIFSLRIEH